MRAGRLERWSVRVRGAGTVEQKRPRGAADDAGGVEPVAALETLDRGLRPGTEHPVDRSGLEPAGLQAGLQRPYAGRARRRAVAGAAGQRLSVGREQAAGGFGTDDAVGGDTGSPLEAQDGCLGSWAEQPVRRPGAPTHSGQQALERLDPARAPRVLVAGAASQRESSLGLRDRRERLAQAGCPVGFASSAGAGQREAHQHGQQGQQPSLHEWQAVCP